LENNRKDGAAQEAYFSFDEMVQRQRLDEVSLNSSWLDFEVLKAAA
jgi:hypothetical protein